METLFNRFAIRDCAARLASKGVYIGTSSWKYPGWLSQLYSPIRYEYRGKVANTRFERDCLKEYAETFKTVCVDAAYYTFPSEKYLAGLVSQVPADFLFGFKVTDLITIRKFPNQPRFGEKAGKANSQFLNGELFDAEFLGPLKTIRHNVGVIMFEFSRFHKTDYAHGRDFLAELDRFLSSLPGGWPYAIEMRNATWLTAEYLACLAKHGVAHVFNSWDAMPPVSEQMAVPGSVTTPNLVAARFLLKPGRKYAEAVEKFQPYEKVQEPNEEARQAGAKLIEEGLETPERKSFIYVNNRLEGNALGTIAAMTQRRAGNPSRAHEERRARLAAALGGCDIWRACWAHPEFVEVIKHDSEDGGEERAIECGLRVLADQDHMKSYGESLKRVCELQALSLRDKLTPVEAKELRETEKKLNLI